MSQLLKGQAGSRQLLMGNEAIVRGALEAGISVAAGYPGTPSSEIIERLAELAKDKENNLYAEWSTNEKVALEVAAAASFAGLKSMAAMKQPGLSVAADFLLHLSATGTRGGTVLVASDDPGAISSTNEGETRPYAKLMEVPLLEPGDFQEAKEMTKWAFELSDTIKNVVLLRTVTRLSHASGTVVFGPLPQAKAQAVFKHEGSFIDAAAGPVLSMPVEYHHNLQQKKLRQAVALFEDAPFNTYDGPEHPELLIITSSVCGLYSKEAVNLLHAEDRVGILKLGTTWPLPPKLLEKNLARTDKILIVEEVLPFLEDEVKVMAMELAHRVGIKTFYGKKGGLLPSVGEMNPDKVVAALSAILGLPYQGVAPDYKQRATEIALTGSPIRDWAFCPGCPHRASFWSINHALAMDNRDGFVCGDIGCYSIAAMPAGFSTLKTLHSMGSGTGLASGFGKLRQFGLEQPVVSVCGDSTFFHSVIPALINAIHNNSDITLVVLDNSGTAMTGFQSHPGLPVDAMGTAGIKIDIPTVCRALGAEVAVGDPFDLEESQQAFLALIAKKGVKVLILRQPCALDPEKKGHKRLEVRVDENVCIGEACGCNRFCTRVFACPALTWDREKNRSCIDDVLCTGCATCVSVCPTGAIKAMEVA
jgi:indolepyruvate ferredoxin oxidoreductase alpha subunit